MLDPVLDRALDRAVDRASADFPWRGLVVVVVSFGPWPCPWPEVVVVAPDPVDEVPEVPPVLTAVEPAEPEP